MNGMFLFYKRCDKGPQYDHENGCLRNDLNYIKENGCHKFKDLVNFVLNESYKL